MPSKLCQTLLQQGCRYGGHVLGLRCDVVVHSIGYRRHQADIVACFDQHAVDHKARRGLAICPRYANDVHALGWETLVSRCYSGFKQPITWLQRR